MSTQGNGTRAWERKILCALMLGVAALVGWNLKMTVDLSMRVARLEVRTGMAKATDAGGIVPPAAAAERVGR
jgi:hypothetical protein